MTDVPGLDLLDRLVEVQVMLGSLRSRPSVMGHPEIQSAFEATESALAELYQIAADKIIDG